MTDLSKWDSDNTLYLFTSLTAGSTHIITATSRMETILKANRIPFTYIDTATNEEAKKLYGRRASGKKLPLLVKEGYVLGGITEVEEWNEFGELHDEIGEVATVNTSIMTAPQNADFKSPYGDPKASAPVASSGSSVASKKTDSTKEKENIPALSEEAQLAMARASSEIASIASEKRKAPSIASTKTTQSKSTPDADTTLVDRTSSVPRSSSESAPKAIFHEVPPAGTPSVKSHRGSSISAAEDEEIKAVEETNTIPEDKEKEEGPGQSVSASGTADAAPAKEKDDSAKSANTPAVTEKEDAKSVKPAPAAEENKDVEKEAAKAAEPSPTPAAEEQQQQQTEKAAVTEGQDKAAEETVDTSKQKAGKGEQAAFRFSIASLFAACFAGRSKTQ